MKITKILAILLAVSMVLSSLAFVACNNKTNKLTTPAVSISSEGVASWNNVGNAEGYVYKIDNGAEITTTSCYVNLTDGQSITVKAVGDGTNYTDSDWSESQTYHASGVTQSQTLDTPVVTLDSDGNATWTAIANASGYAYKIDNGAETTTLKRSVTLSDGQSIAVKAVGDGVNYFDSNYSDSVTYTAPVEETYFYESNADAVQDGEVRYLVYTTNKTSGETDSVIAVKQGTQSNGEWTYGERNIAIEGGSDWDKYIGSASIVKGTFSLDGTTYSWLIAYSASASSNEKANQIGIAVSQDPMGEWIKVGTEPLIAYDKEQYGETMVGCYAPSVINYDKQSGIRIYYSYADAYGHFQRFFDADMSNLAEINGDSVLYVTTNGKIQSGDSTTMFPNADWAYDATNKIFYAVKDYSPSLATTPSYAYEIELLTISESELYTTEVETGWTSLGYWDYMDLTLGEYSVTYSACIVSDAYGHLIDASSIELIYNVCQNQETQGSTDYLFSQEFRTYVYSAQAAE